MTTETTVEQEPTAGPVGAVTDEQLISMLVARARGDGVGAENSSEPATWPFVPQPDQLPLIA